MRQNKLIRLGVLCKKNPRKWREDNPIYLKEIQKYMRNSNIVLLMIFKPVILCPASLLSASNKTVFPHSAKAICLLDH